MATKFERIYNQIKTEVLEIKNRYDYFCESAAFGHLILKMLFDISDDEANESITDGSDDNGIDAVYFEKKITKQLFTFFNSSFHHLNQPLIILSPKKKF